MNKPGKELPGWFSFYSIMYETAQGYFSAGALLQVVNKTLILPSQKTQLECLYKSKELLDKSLELSPNSRLSLTTYATCPLWFSVTLWYKGYRELIPWAWFCCMKPFELIVFVYLFLILLFESMEAWVNQNS